MSFCIVQSSFLLLGPSAGPYLVGVPWDDMNAASAGNTAAVQQGLQGGVRSGCSNEWRGVFSPWNSGLGAWRVGRSKVSITLHRGPDAPPPAPCCSFPPALPWECPRPSPTRKHRCAVVSGRTAGTAASGKLVSCLPPLPWLLWTAPPGCLLQPAHWMTMPGLPCQCMLEPKAAYEQGAYESWL